MTSASATQITNIFIIKSSIKVTCVHAYSIQRREKTEKYNLIKLNFNDILMRNYLKHMCAIFLSRPVKYHSILELASQYNQTNRQSGFPLLLFLFNIFVSLRSFIKQPLKIQKHTNNSQGNNYGYMFCNMTPSTSSKCVFNGIGKVFVSRD